MYTPSIFIKPANELPADQQPEQSESVINMKSLTAVVEQANKTTSNIEKREAIIGLNKPALMARLRDRVTVLENDIRRLHQQMRNGGGSSEFINPYFSEPLARKRSYIALQNPPPPPPPDENAAPKNNNSPFPSVSTPAAMDPNPLVGGPKRMSPGSRSQQRRRPQSSSHMLGESTSSANYGESEPSNPGDNIDYSNFKSAGSYRYQLMKMRYSRRYANYLPYRFGMALIDEMSEEEKKKVDVPRVQCYGWNMSGVHYIKPRQIPDPAILVTESVARSLLAYFFDNINPLYSILHKPMFMEQFDAYLLAPDKKECRLFMSILHVVCAITIRYCEICENRQYDAGLEERLFDDAHATLQAFSFEWESLEIIQGYLLLALYLRACHRQPSAWGVLGTAIRMTLGMGLMHKTQVNCYTSDYEILKYERVFWACFVLDRTFCIDYGRHFSFREDEITMPIPHYYVDDGWQTPISNALLRFCLSLSDLIYDRDLELNSDDLKNVKARLAAWNDAMQEFGLDSDTDLAAHPKLPASLVGHFRLHYYNSLFFIHMRSVYGLIGLQWDTPHIDRPLYIKCVKGVVSITHTLSKLHQLKTPWWLTLSNLYHAGCVALMLIYNQIAVRDMGAALTSIMALITEISNDGKFIMARECLWSLKTLNHMVCMKLGQTRALLPAAGIDHGTAIINRGNFSSMGVVDHQGNEQLHLSVDGEKRKVDFGNGNGSGNGSGNDTIDDGNRYGEASQQQHQVVGSPELNTNNEPLYPLGILGPSSSSSTTAATGFEGTKGYEGFLYEAAMLNVSPADEANDPIMSLEWFDNWDWDLDLGSTMAGILNEDDENGGPSSK